MHFLDIFTKMSINISLRDKAYWKPGRVHRYVLIVFEVEPTVVLYPRFKVGTLEFL